MLIDVKFKYQNEKEVIQFDAKSKIIDACKTFLASRNTDLESKIIIFQGQEDISHDSNLTFEEEMEALNIKGDKCKIIFYDDSKKKEGINVVVNQGGGEKMVVRAQKGENIMSVFKKLKLNVKNKFFLKSGSTIDNLDQRVSLLANKQDKIDKTVQLLAIDKEDDEEDEDNNNLIENNIGNNNVQQNNNDNNNEGKDDLTEKNEEIPHYDIPEDKLRKYVRDSYFFLTIIYEFIIFFVVLGCLNNVNDKFNASTGTMLGTFIPVTIVGAMMSICVIHFYDDIDFGCKSLITFFLFYVAFITFYCYLLSYFTHYKFIVWMLIVIAINYLAMALYLFYNKSGLFGSYIILFVIDIVIPIITYNYIFDMTYRNLYNSYVIILAFLIFNYFTIICIKFKIRNETEIEVSNWKSTYISMSISYGTFYPALIAIVLIIVLIYLLISLIKCIASCFICCDCYDCCDCCDCCECCDDCCI